MAVLGRCTNDVSSNYYNFCLSVTDVSLTVACLTVLSMQSGYDKHCSGKMHLRRCCAGRWNFGLHVTDTDTDTTTTDGTTH
jgi:hypothetical protein